MFVMLHRGEFAGKTKISNDITRISEHLTEYVGFQGTVDSKKREYFHRFPLFTPCRDDISGPNGTGKTRARQGLNLALPDPRVHCH